MIPCSVKWSDMQSEERRRSWLFTWKFLIYLHVHTFVWLQTYYFVLTHRSACVQGQMDPNRHAKNTPQGHSFLLCEWYIKEWLSLQMKSIKRGECDVICIPNLRSMKHKLLQISLQHGSGCGWGLNSLVNNTNAHWLDLNFWIDLKGGQLCSHSRCKPSLCGIWRPSQQIATAA